MNRIPVLAIVAALANPVAAQTVAVLPANPSAGDSVVLRLSPGASWIGSTVTRTG